jgi:LPXTG-motif cell wall-anchored protein
MKKEKNMRVRPLLLGLVVVALIGSSAQAATYGVDVGYADNLRPSPFFPIPWQGDPNVIFLGGGADYDTGAIKINNTDSVAWTLTDVKADSFGDGASFQIWGGLLGTGLVVNPGQSVILVQTSQYNFDSSDDEGGNPFAIPVVHITIDGVTQAFSDTGQVLNTEGTDALAQAGLNESHQWRPIGTFGGQAGTVPLPSTAWSGMLLLGGLGLVLRNRKSHVA